VTTRGSWGGVPSAQRFLLFFKNNAI